MVDPLLGAEVGRYRIERKLGQGGMGSVYLAIQPMIGSRVAIKVLSQKCADDPALVERFFSEARAVNLIRHEHIVNILDLAVLGDGRPYIVMEYIEGHTLGQLIRNVHAPLGAVAVAIGDVLAALDAAHAIGIVHRDLKPDNILITTKGHTKVLDFGIAKLSVALQHELAPRTHTGALLGTPAYMSPEQIANANTVDGRADLYAIGVVLFEAVTGYIPFTGSAFELMRAHLEQPPPSPRALRPEISPALEQVILTALAKDPARRFGSARAMATALRGATQDLERGRLVWATAGSSAVVETPVAHSVVETPVAPAPTPATAAHRGRGWWWAIAAVAAVLGGVGIVVIARGVGTRSTPPADAAAADVPRDATTVAVRRDATATIDVPPDATTVVAARDAAPVDRTKVAIDVRRFDGVAFVPEAIAVARSHAADARLVEVQLSPLARTGLVDLTRAGPKGPKTHFVFVSSHEPCLLVLDVSAGGLAVTRFAGPCSRTPVRSPQCKLGRVIERSGAWGLFPEVTTSRNILTGRFLAGDDDTSQWIFETELFGEPESLEVADEC